MLYQYWKINHQPGDNWEWAVYIYIYTLPILDTWQKMTNSLLVNVDIPIDTKRLVRISLYPCKIDLVYIYIYLYTSHISWEFHHVHDAISMVRSQFWHLAWASGDGRPDLDLDDNIWAEKSVALDHWKKMPWEIAGCQVCNEDIGYITLYICVYIYICIYIYIWANYNNSHTWIKAILGWFPLLKMIPVRSQWGRYNSPRYIYIYDNVRYTTTATAWFFGCIWKWCLLPNGSK